MPRVERARPLLGTIVAIRVEGAEETALVRAIGDAFAAIARVHDRMSFQSPDSDLAAIGRLAAGGRCAVDPATAACLAAALRLSAETDGVFDPVLPDAGASWRDVWLDGHVVTVRRALRLDLSGIAKGFAVDRACDVLREAGIGAATVNAGGDLRVFGRGETIMLMAGPDAPSAAVRIENGALASSDVPGSLAEHGMPCHRDGRSGVALATGFVSVAAPLCRDADALTKLVLAIGDEAVAALARHGAVAYLYDGGKGWRTIGDEA